MAELLRDSQPYSLVLVTSSTIRGLPYLGFYKLHEFDCVAQFQWSINIIFNSYLDLQYRHHLLQWTCLSLKCQCVFFAFYVCSLSYFSPE